MSVSVTSGDHNFESPWTLRYEVRVVDVETLSSFVVVDLKFDGMIVARFGSRSEAALERAALTLEHLKRLRSEKLNQWSDREGKTQSG